ncbi:MAG: hypothetical protein GQ574_07065 [Crocinitomix sp.]|nr:hypothetical protein [Crocinitomix sp.]
MKTEILKYLCYFDIFNHPLQKRELVRLCATTEADLIQVLEELKLAGTCFELDDYISIQADIEALVQERQVKEKRAKKYFDKLPFYAKLIRAFPFVKGIAISGSMSKNVMHEDGDIDYFIITDKGRLWICRTFLVVFKKIFLLNSKKYFCVNYFVDEENLFIPDENIFTAIEIQYLLPVYNQEIISQFRAENNWTSKFINEFERFIDVKEVKGKSWIGRFIQFTFKGKMGDRFDLYLMKFTYKKWEKKFKHFDAAKFNLTMRSNRGVSKHHPRDFQNRVLKEYAQRMEQFESNVESNHVK